MRREGGEGGREGEEGGRGGGEGGRDGEGGRGGREGEGMGRGEKGREGGGGEGGGREGGKVMYVVFNCCDAYRPSGERLVNHLIRAAQLLNCEVTDYGKSSPWRIE